MVKRKFMRKVKKVVDGDTLVVDKPVNRSRYIRLAGIDTPEKNKRGFQTAKDNLRSRVSGKKIWVRPVAKDKYGRTVAKVRKVRKDKK